MPVNCYINSKGLYMSFCLCYKCMKVKLSSLCFQVQKWLESLWSKVLFLLHIRDDSDMNQDYLFYIDLLLFVG